MRNIFGRLKNWHNRRKTSRIVDREIADLRKQLVSKGMKDDPIMHTLNNFYLQIIDTGMAYRNHFKQSPFLEVFNVPYKAIVFGNERVYPDGKHSKVFLQQTPHQFFETLDKTLEETYIDKNEVKKLAASKNYDDRLKMYHLLLPAYIRMRELGYTKGELTG